MVQTKILWLSFLIMDHYFGGQLEGAGQSSGKTQFIAKISSIVKKLIYLVISKMNQDTNENPIMLGKFSLLVPINVLSPN